MDSDKSIVLRAFNKLFFELIDDIISVYPDNVEMLTARESFLTFKKMNPTSIVKVWFSGVYSKYKTEIDAGNLAFFTEKDYSGDLNGSNVNNSQNVLNMIDKVREPIKNMNAQNSAQVTKYIQGLSKLSNAYALSV
jgi:hypothetical protein